MTYRLTITCPNGTGEPKVTVTSYVGDRARDTIRRPAADDDRLGAGKRVSAATGISGVDCRGAGCVHRSANRHAS